MKTVTFKFDTCSDCPYFFYKDNFKFDYITSYPICDLNSDIQFFNVDYDKTIHSDCELPDNVQGSY